MKPGTIGYATRTVQGRHDRDRGGRLDRRAGRGRLRIEWTFEKVDDGTRVTYATQYGIPVPVLDAVVEPFAARYNERELRTTLENLRTRLEGETA